MGNVFGKNPYQSLNAKQKENLNAFFTEIVNKDSMDYNNQELQDISTAVRIMLEMVIQRISNRGVFSISHIQPCGSMVEKTSLWKLSKETGEPATEFDFLAVLKEPFEKVPNHSCLLCQPVKKLPVNLELLRKYYNKAEESLGDGVNVALKINHLFVQELNFCIASSCNCFSVQYELDDVDETHFRRISFNQQGPTCSRCTVDMPTGSLRVNTCIDIDSSSGSPADCSLIFLWTSKIQSLNAPVDLTLQKTSPVANLPVYVDFLPALQLNTSSANEHEHDVFLVAKRCHQCLNDRWRKSIFVTEINYMQIVMTEKHLKCFKIFKYLMKVCAHRGVNLMYFNQYVVKNVAFQHDMECSDSSKDIAECVVKMLCDLEHAYKSGRLISLVTGANIIMFNIYGNRFDYIRQIIDRLCSVSETDSWETFAQKLTTKLNW